ncbi:MAG: PqqD family protein [Desulfobacterales bacterium]|nr:PqqD family protein [Desulfobacterales bacterium]
MLEINHDDIFILAENIFLQKIDEIGKHWVFNIDTGEHYSLNETSYWILEQVAEELPVKDIFEKFVESFEVDKNQSEDDFTEIMKGFLAEGIVNRAASPDKKEGEK